MTDKKRLYAFIPREVPFGKVVWVRAGSAWMRPDGGVEVFLDVLPLEGRVVLSATETPPSGAENAVDPRTVGL